MPRTPMTRTQARDAQNNYIIALPQRASAALYTYNDTLVRAISDPSYRRDVAFYAEHCQYQRPPNPFTWAANQGSFQYVIFDSADSSSNAAEHVTRLQTYYSDNPDMTSLAWCNHPPEDYIGPRLPYKTVGSWAPAVCSGISFDWNGGTRVYDDTLYDCFHCALVAAKAHVTEGRPHVCAANCYEWSVLDACYYPQYEVIGIEENNFETIKDVADPVENSCGNCGRVGHRSAACSYPEKAHQKVGVEVEGRWLRLRDARSRALGLGMPEGYCDSSVNYNDATGAQPWEFQTTPGSCRQACQQVLDIYPDECDASCGMHVHVSFDAADMTLLNSPAFFRYFKQRWEAWGARMELHPQGQFFKRLRGENEFCLPAEERPYSPTSMHRYAQLNFSAFREHGTVECRLLPMFRRSSLAVSAIQELVDIYETYLAAPEQYGHAGFSYAATGFTKASGYVYKAVLSRPLEIPSIFNKKAVMDINMVELPPVPSGHKRVAMPINSPITIKGLAAAIAKQKAA